MKVYVFLKAFLLEIVHTAGCKAVGPRGLGLNIIGSDSGDGGALSQAAGHDGSFYGYTV